MTSYSFVQWFVCWVIPLHSRAWIPTLFSVQANVIMGLLADQGYTTTPLTFSRPLLDTGHDPPSSLDCTQLHGKPTLPYFYKGKVWAFGGGSRLTMLNDVWTLEVGPGRNGMVGLMGERLMHWEEVEMSGWRSGAWRYHTATLIWEPGCGNWSLYMFRRSIEWLRVWTSWYLCVSVGLATLHKHEMSSNEHISCIQRWVDAGNTQKVG